MSGPAKGGLLTALSHLGLAIEVTPGTPVTATAWVPIPMGGFKPQDVLKYVPDEGFRGQPTEVFGQYLGVTSSTYDVDGMLFPLSGGNFFAAIFGADTVTGTTDVTHSFKLASDGSVPSYTISDYYVAGARQWPGCKLEKLVIKFTPEAGVSYTANWLGWPSATYTTSTQTFESEAFFLGWQGAISLAGTADANLSSLTLTLTRQKSAALFSAADSQSPYDIFVGPMTADWDVEYFMGDDSEYTPALTQATQAVVATITQTTGSAVLTLTSNAVQWTQPTINRAKDYILVSVKGSGVYNSTDGGPVAVTLLNTISTSYATAAAS